MKSQSVEIKNELLRLISLSQKKKLKIIPSSIFLFTKYIQNFKKQIQNYKKINNITFVWSDIENEKRYGDNKLIDYEIMIYEDFLHHILPLFKYLFDVFPKYNKIKKIDRGGAKVDLEFNFKKIPVLFKLNRKSKKRERQISIKSKNEILLDFSNEPGIILVEGEKYIADENWHKLDKPLISMIKIYFKIILNLNSNLKINYHLKNSIKQLK